MGSLLAQLTPEMLGLAVTPAAIVACLVLLGSDHPIRNVATIAAVFFSVYALLTIVIVVAGHNAAGSGGHVTLRAWLSIIAGLVFLAAAAATWRRRPRTGDAPSEPPPWVRRLARPSARFVVVISFALAVANPNIAILASGGTAIAVADVSGGERTIAVLVLLASSMIDFALPALLFALAGPHGRQRLRETTRWLIVHNRPIGIGVLLTFGVLFLGRGLLALLG